ncbi:hypothetical protein [Methylomonas sp. AM2-LC]|uniref:hypothetical protein n=1 Tax=Methylomonas sp. AM2-LC TaxID=3153301 RepID=UPI0032670492
MKIPTNNSGSFVRVINVSEFMAFKNSQHLSRLTEPKCCRSVKRINSLHDEIKAQALVKPSLGIFQMIDKGSMINEK